MTWANKWALWRHPVGVVLFVLFCDACAAVAVFHAVGVPGRALSMSDVILVALAVLAQPGMAILSRRFGRFFTSRVEVVTDPTDLAAVPLMLLLPMSAAVPAVAAVMLLHGALQRRLCSDRPPALYQIVFNVSVHTSAWVAARLAYDLVAGGQGLGSAAGVVGVAVLLLVHGLMVWAPLGAVLTLLGQCTFRGSFSTAYLQHLPGNLTASAGGVLVTFCWAAHPLSAVFILPMLMAVQKSVVYSRLLEQARTDAKTGLVNAERWRHVAEGVVTRTRNGGAPTAVLVVDLDHFKRINDTYGHLAGDDVIKEVAGRLSAAVRPTDLVGRFGGEEFVILLPGAGADDALRAATRCLEAVRSTPVVASGIQITVTASIGVAATSTGTELLSELLEAADAGLYRAKAAGRNRVFGSDTQDATHVPGQRLPSDGPSSRSKIGASVQP